MKGHVALAHGVNAVLKLKTNERLMISNANKTLDFGALQQNQ